MTGSDGYTGVYGGTAYPAGKGAVASLGLSMAGDLKNHGVRVNVVCPGARTRMSTGDDSLNVAGPEYVAPLYVYLISDLAEGITGKVLNGSGGFIAEYTIPQKQPKGYRDPQSNPPYTLEEVNEIVRR